jgi:hypothetical protein
MSTLLLTVTALALCWILLPLALMTASLTREASFIYKRINSGEWDLELYLRHLFDALPS